MLTTMQLANHIAITREIFARMMFECICHQVSIVGGDANRLVISKDRKTVGWFLQHGNLSVLDRQNGTNLGSTTSKNVLKTNKDMNVRQFHSTSFLDLKYLRDTMEGKVDLDPAVRKETERIGDCCLLTFFEYGLSTPS